MYEQRGREGFKKWKYMYKRRSYVLHYVFDNRCATFIQFIVLTLMIYVVGSVYYELHPMDWKKKSWMPMRLDDDMGCIKNRVMFSSSLIFCAYNEMRPNFPTLVTCARCMWFKLTYHGLILYLINGTYWGSRASYGQPRYNKNKNKNNKFGMLILLLILIGHL